MLVVEHDEETILEADWVVDMVLVPENTEIIYSGPVKGLTAARSITGDYLRGN